MQITHKNPPRPMSNNLQMALDALNRAAQDWDQAERKIDQVDRYVSTAEREFRSAEHPARQASWDNERTNSSGYGYRLDRHFRTGGNALDDSRFDLRSADRGLGLTGQGIDRGQVHLNSLAQEYRESGDTQSLAQVQSAQRELASSEQSFSQVGSSWRSVDSNLRFTSPKVRRSDFDISQIRRDRQGVNVSHYGRQVSNNIRSIQMDIRRVDSDLRRSSGNEDRGEQHLDNAIRLLQSLSSSGEFEAPSE